MRALVRLLLGVAAVSSAACGPTVDLTKGLQVTIVTTGWYDVGIVNGQNKLVPAVSFTLKNISDQKLVSLQVNAQFKRVSEADEWGTQLVTAAGSSGLPAGGTTDVLVAKSPRGYTGSDQSRQEMLQNSHFVDAKVDLFVKYGSTQWTRIGTYPITRQLLAK
ncbi:MAG TPA: hypothetical protein VKE51_28015 [Vicinamibacterales bacterium]|nr:hypothetical protein [Vicinamibacterales bacterium]